MGARGPLPTPTKIKQLAGDPGRQASGTDEPEPVPGAPEMPPHLTGLAAETWEWLCERLAELQLLATSDKVVMALFCGAWARYVENYDVLAQIGTVIVSIKTDKWGRQTKTPYIGPHLNIESMLSKQLTTYSAAMGLGPAWRAGVSKLPQAETKEGKSRLFSSNLKVVG